MDQSVVAGIGNIYRAEVLFKARCGDEGGLEVCAWVWVWVCGWWGGRLAMLRPLLTCPALPQAGVHPEQPGSSLGRPAFDRVWRHSVLLLQARRRGVHGGGRADGRAGGEQGLRHP